jgi:hypothetical protein
MSEKDEASPQDSPTVDAGIEIYGLLASLVMHSEQTRWTRATRCWWSTRTSQLGQPFSGTDSFDGKESPLRSYLCRLPTRNLRFSDGALANTWTISRLLTG